MDFFCTAGGCNFVSLINTSQSAATLPKAKPEKPTKQSRDKKQIKISQKMKNLLKISFVFAFVYLFSGQSFAATIVNDEVPVLIEKNISESPSQTTTETNSPVSQILVERDCCGTCTVSVNLLIFSFTYEWCCNRCEEEKPESVDPE